MKPTGAVHHIHKRNRPKKSGQHLLSKERIKMLDKIILIISIINPLTILPQLYNVWVNKNALGVSLTTWSLFTLFSIPMFIYGYVHKEKPIMIMYAMFLVLNMLVVIGTLLYR
ncbi:MAG: hypothetical protein HY831_03915 [Candidatus Aenigmarchaeota archaeon]|nr:hypothetical protein [Candidatus Aenigmarchaeota archaeon]